MVGAVDAGLPSSLALRSPCRCAARRRFRPHARERGYLVRRQSPDHGHAGRRNRTVQAGEHIRGMGK